MDVYFGVGGELLTPLEEMLDGDIKLSLELDFDIKDPLSNGLGSADDWNGWSSLHRTSPSFDFFGDKDSCVLVSPEAVMPLIKREVIKEEPVSPVHQPFPKEEPRQMDGLSAGVREEEEENSGDDEEEEENSDEDEEEEHSAEEEEEQEEEDDQEGEKQVYWNSILKKSKIITETVPLSYLGRKKTEIVVAKPSVPPLVLPKSSSSNPPQQTLKVLHATKKPTRDSSPAPANQNSRTILTNKRYKDFDFYPKPAYSYSCLIAMALKNSITGSLPVSEIYSFMCEHFPYFESAPSAWKNSVRHNLSLNKCFEKIEKGSGGGCRKGCLWAMNPAKVAKMDDEVAKWSKKDPVAIRRAMKYPDELERLERGEMKIGERREESCDSGAEDDESESNDDSSDSDSEEVPPSLKRFDSRLSSQESNDLGLPDEMYEELGYLEEVMSSDTETTPGPEVKRVRLGLEPYQRQPVRPV